MLQNDGIDLLVNRFINHTKAPYDTKNQELQMSMCNCFQLSQTDFSHAGNSLLPVQFF